MVKKIISKVLKQRHYWRSIGFDELSELYTSMLFRNLALSLVGIFVPIFLYNQGFSITEIMLFFTVFLLTKVPTDFVSGELVARYGPKHTMFISYITYAIALGMLSSYSTFLWPSYLMAIFWGISNSLFFISFHVNFSKVKHRAHGGKELGVLNIMERTGAMLGPLVGGVIATLFGAQYIFLAASLFFVAALIPLFLSKEPTRTGQKLDYFNFNLNKVKYDLLSHASLGVENVSVNTIWPLFLAMFVIKDNTYLGIGILTSLTVVIAILIAKTIGKLVDKRRGRSLLRASAIANSILCLVRPFTFNFSFAAAVNFFNEMLLTSIKIPYVKGMYDRADDFEGYRIVYIVSQEAFSNFMKSLFFAVLAVLSTSLSAYSIAFIAFMVSSVTSLLIMKERYPALDVK